MTTIILFGPPGSGKGTQSTALQQQYNLYHVSTGNILRDHITRNTDLGQQAKAIMDRGDLIDDNTILSMVEDVIDEHNSVGSGFIFDGFPRTLAQAQALNQLYAARKMKIDAAILLEVDDEELIARILQRAKAEGRSDDNEEVLKARLSTYNEQTSPLIPFYEDQGALIRVNGMQTIQQVTNDILSAADKKIS